MENATKALLIAGGILLALLVLGAVVLLMNSLSSYQSSNYASIEEEQIAKFNSEFINLVSEKKLKGVNIISAADKIYDYNTRKPTIGNIDYKEITLIINMDNATSYVDDIFGEIVDQKKLIEGTSKCVGVTKFRDAERKTNIEIMNKLASKAQEIKNHETTIEELIGYNLIIDQDVIDQYYAYSLYKKSNFKFDGENYYENGQLKEINVSIK